ncbi:MAG TPA: helical backbone metal receptor, partial [Gemmatimonadaceae bacterium]|nr:helical backbone metal receptor [Gemmatimonadaceae bacterium]
MRSRHWIAPAGLVVAVVVACHGGDRARDAARTPAAADSALRRDDFGAPLAAASGAGASPARIVSLNPTTTEILFTIGAGARVVGRTAYDLYPAAARRVPSLGPGIRPNVEAVLAARPDLVVLYASGDNRAAAEQLRALGIPTVAFKVDDIAGFRRVTRALGRLLGEPARAERVVDSVDATLRRVAAATASLPHPSVFVHTWDDPLLTIGRGSFMSELITIAGGRNLYDDLAAPSPAVALEDVVRRDPDVVLASPE